MGWSRKEPTLKLSSDNLCKLSIFILRSVQSRQLIPKRADWEGQLQRKSNSIRCCLHWTNKQPTKWKFHRKSLDVWKYWRVLTWWILFCMDGVNFIVFVFLRVRIFESGSSIVAGQQQLIQSKQKAIKQCNCSQWWLIIQHMRIWLVLRTSRLRKLDNML